MRNSGLCIFLKRAMDSKRGLNIRRNNKHIKMQSNNILLFEETNIDKKTRKMNQQNLHHSNHNNICIPSPSHFLTNLNLIYKYMIIHIIKYFKKPIRRLLSTEHFNEIKLKFAASFLKIMIKKT